MEIVLADGDRIIMGKDVNAAALARVVKVLSRRCFRFRAGCGSGWRSVTPICGVMRSRVMRSPWRLPS
jgi:hypothetical protein